MDLLYKIWAIPTVRTEVYDRVLTEARFDGIDCYVKLLNHLKSISAGENIHALLNVRN